MDDLISRSNFEKNILQAFDSKLNEHDAELMVEFLDYLDDEPTAYNMDKVVEENKQMKEVIYKASEELQKIIDYPHGIISCVQFFPKLREIQDELVGILEDRQVE